MATLFSKIINGEIPCHKIAENERFLAFLDVFPLVEGHTLVVPKIEVDYIFDLDDEYLAAINLFARDVAAQIKAAIPCKRIGIAVIGLEVPHAHMHLVPLNGIADINFDRPKLKPSSEELAAVAARIRG
jgi:histidine triad (HIT) family protein